MSAFGIHVCTHSRLFRCNSAMFFLLVSFCVYTQSVLASVSVCVYVGVPACVCVQFCYGMFEMTLRENKLKICFLFLSYCSMVRKIKEGTWHVFV